MNSFCYILVVLLFFGGISCFHRNIDLTDFSMKWRQHHDFRSLVNIRLFVNKIGEQQSTSYYDTVVKYLGSPDCKTTATDCDEKSLTYKLYSDGKNIDIATIIVSKGGKKIELVEEY